MSPFAWRRWVVPALVLASPWAGLAKMTPEQLARLPAPVSHPVNFARDIKPILEASCVKCHGRGKAKGGFRLDDRSAFLAPADSGPAVVVGRSAESYLIELVAGVDPDNVMPQKGSRLKPEQIALLRAWIDQGLPWDEGVTFARQPTRNLRPRSVELPPSREGLDHPVDRLLEPYFVARQIRPGEPVDDRTFARRVHLDVIGLLPTPEE
ncbi:MAG TPA: c-type cytochrome domain-containing protein, partial [Methylomirabilota bacterium]|nr:c-type cytochrome domain-containing protein [Methylomirabilota bacterium]